VLKKWYDAFCAGYAEDATGAVALEKILGKTLPEIEADWVAWIGKLPAVPQVVPGGPALGVALSQAADGLQVEDVARELDAGGAGLQKGDVIVGADGERVIEFEELTSIVLRHRPGETLALEFRRGEQYGKATMPLGALTPRKPDAAR
jgi:S1-C subfamily serine protease